MPPAIYFSGNFTIMAWVKIYAYVNYQRFLDCASCVNQDNVIIALSEGNQMGVNTYAGASTTTDRITSYTATLNTWFHVAWTVSGSLAQVYANGVQVLTSNGTVYAPLAVNRTQCYFGKSNFGDPFANADFDEIKFFNRALSQTEIQNDYNNIQSYMAQF
jgi:hypothetical protein